MATSKQSAKDSKQKKPQKQDPKLVAAKDDDESEVKYIAARYKIPISKVRQAMKAVGKNGKPSRSRRVIYIKLREMGYTIKTRYTK